MLHHHAIRVSTVLLAALGFGVAGLSAQDPTEQTKHPLDRVIREAEQALEIIQKNYTSYTCTLIKLERINGKLAVRQTIFIKIRNEPFSVYMKFDSPNNIKGQQVVYVDGQNNGNLLAKPVGLKGFMTYSLLPTSALAMAGQKYPITEVGLLNLTERLIDVAKHDRKYDESDVTFFPNAKINGRKCTCIQVLHPVRRDRFLFHIARIFIDKETMVPIRYASYDWPKTKGQKPPLIEEYTYLNLEIDNKLSDKDFKIH